jgi:hypothetical protein
MQVVYQLGNEVENFENSPGKWKVQGRPCDACFPLNVSIFTLCYTKVLPRSRYHTIKEYRRHAHKFYTFLMLILGEAECFLLQLSLT